MAIGLVGKKCGMTRIFTEAGISIPVTVVEVTANRISQIKTQDTDGYQAIQVTTGERRDSRVNAAQKGHFAKAGVAAGRGTWEFRVEDSELEGREAGSEIAADLFQVGQIVDVFGTSKGKGFKVVSNATTSVHKMGHMVTQYLTALWVLQVKTKHRVVYLKAKKCQVKWVTNV